MLFFNEQSRRYLSKLNVCIMCRVAFTTFAAKATYTEILKKIEGKGLDYCCFEHQPLGQSRLHFIIHIVLFILQIKDVKIINSKSTVKAH